MDRGGVKSGDNLVAPQCLDSGCIQATHGETATRHPLARVHHFFLLLPRDAHHKDISQGQASARHMGTEIRHPGV